jgi:hypothetical protein
VERLTAMQGETKDATQGRRGETFAAMVVRILEEKGIADRECISRANVDRRLLGKIRNNKDYKPSKQTVLAFAMALELPLEEARELMTKAGYGLSHGSRTDVAVEYCITTGHYDVTALNAVLFKLKLQPLGY